jgi:hypothetical protein
MRRPSTAPGGVFLAGSAIFLVLVSGAPAAGAPDGIAPGVPPAEIPAGRVKPSAAITDARTVTERFATKEALSTAVASETAPEGSEARQASWVDARDLVEMSAYDGVITAAISRTASPSAFQAARKSIDGARGRSAVTVRRSSLTKDELFAVRVRVAELYEQQAAPGAGVFYAFDAAKDALVVRGNVAPALAERLKDLGHVQVETSPSYTVERTQGSRYRDTGPWKFGGATLRNLAGGNVCTSGFTMQGTNNRTYVVTAGHCGQAGDDFESGNGNWYSRAGAKAPYPTWDALKLECCDANFGRDYWITNNVSRKQLTAYNVGVGQHYICHSGQTGNAEYCAMTITSGNGTICTPECTSGLYEYTSNTTNSWPGDSGMSVYTKNVQGLMHVHGMQVGHGRLESANRRYNFAEKWEGLRDRFGGAIRSW